MAYLHGGRTVYRIGVAIIWGLCLGCATTEPLLVDLNPGSSPAGVRPPSVCHIVLREVSDARPGKEDLGALGTRIVQGANVIEWVRHAMERLEANPTSDESRAGEATLPKQLTVIVALKKLYIHTLQSSMGGTVLLSAQYRAGQGNPETHMYRGSETSVIWTGSAASVADMLNTIMDDIVERMRSDLQQLCHSLGPARIPRSGREGEELLSNQAQKRDRESLHDGDGLAGGGEVRS